MNVFGMPSVVAIHPNFISQDVGKPRFLWRTGVRSHTWGNMLSIFVAQFLHQILPISDHAFYGQEETDLDPHHTIRRQMDPTNLWVSIAHYRLWARAMDDVCD